MFPGRIALLASIAAGFCFADSLPDALRSRRFQDALALADALLQTKPSDPALWTGRGIALAGLNRDQASISSFEKALQFAPGFLPAIKGAVEAGYRSRDGRTAGFLDRLIRLEPGNGVAHAIAGVLAFEAGDCARAVPHFETASAETASNEQAWPLYGACLVAVGHVAQAVEVFQWSLASHPENAVARFNLGYAQVLAHRHADAVKTLEPLASVAEPKADALNLLAVAEAAEGRLESAVAHLQQAIQAAPKDERNYFDLAALCMQNESADTAAAIVEAGLKNVPKSARLRTIRGILLAQLGKYDEAAAEFELANRLDPSGQYGASGLGVLYTEMHQAHLASAVLRERLRKSPGDGTLNFLLAQALTQEGVKPGSPGFLEAVRSLRLAVAAKPDLAKAHSLLGKLLAESGDYPRAVDELQLGAKHDPSDRMAFSQLAIVLRRLGRDTEAAAAVAALKWIIITEAQPKANYKLIRMTPAVGRP